jgi:hypothetical protein
LKDEEEEMVLLLEEEKNLYPFDDLLDEMEVNDEMLFYFLLKMKILY